MTVLPIVERELRVAARQPLTHWLRVGVAGVVLFGCCQAMSRTGPVPPAREFGASIFYMLVVSAFVLCASACLLTADVLSRERREGTWGLLFLANLRPHDVLAGKLVASGLGALGALAAFLPALAVPILLGGVSGELAIRCGLALVNTLFWSLAVGLWASSGHVEWFKSARRAMTVMLLTALVPALQLIAAQVTRGSFAGFWCFVGLTQALAWAFLSLARRNLIELPFETLAEPDVEAAQSFAPELAFVPVNLPLAAGANPIEWIVHRQRGVRTALWAGGLTTLAYTLVFTALARLFGIWEEAGFVTLTLVSFTVAAVASAMFAWGTTRFFQEARRTGQLEVLLSTPLGANSIVRGQWRALRRMIRWPVIVSLAVPIGELAVVTAKALLGIRSELSATLISAPFNILLGLLQAVAICWLGMKFGLSARRPFLAIAWTAGLASALPQGAGIVIWQITALLSSPLDSTGIGHLYPWIYFAALLALETGLIFWARRRLHEDLRKVAFARLNAHEDLAAIGAWFRGLFRRERQLKTS